jgi:carbon-monoxide dehydrogenase large subunit
MWSDMKSTFYYKNGKRRIVYTLLLGSHIAAPLVHNGYFAYTSERTIIEENKRHSMAYASLMGVRVKRKEDPRLITGSGVYVGDMTLLGMRHVTFVRSPYAHANIRTIDTAAALARPGVVAVVTGAELAQLCEPMPMSSAGESGAASADSHQGRTHYALSVGRVRHVGEAVAAVIADTPAAAADAAAEVLVDWEPLPAVADMERAAAAGAPLLFDHVPGNVAYAWKRKTDGADAAFASAARVVRQRIVSQRLSGVPMEGRAVLAAPDSTIDGLTVWSSTQGPHISRSQIAKALRLPENAVRVIVPDVGGGFGVKIGVYPEDVALAALALKYRMPLRWVETRIEHMVATTHGRAQIADIEAAVQPDGTITALRLRVLADLGAYPLAPDIPELTGQMAVGVYHIAEVDLEITCVFTNTTPVAAYRGAGRPEAAYYIERLMDVIAGELGMDLVEVRRRNFIAPDAFPYETPTEHVYDSGEYDRALTKALEISNYAGLREEQRQRRVQGSGISEPEPRTPNPDRLLGIGIACYVEMCAFGYESATVRVDPTGTVAVFTGTSPHGQGIATAFAQITADQIGADFDTIVVKHGDTSVTSFGMGTMGSRSLAVGGSAVFRAAAQVRDKARRIAAHMLEAAPEDVVLSGGRYQVKGTPEPALTLAQIADRAYSDDLPDDIAPGLEATDYFKPPKLTYPFGAHVAVVEVERETGIVHVRDIYTVDDCGPRVSPMLAEGQVHGGLAQGIAQALWEEVVYDESGQLLTGSLMDYVAPRASMLPNFKTDQTETPTPRNPLGAKGIGEAATIGSTPAVVNAVIDALGVRHLDMPLRAEKVWQAMQEKGG